MKISLIILGLLPLGLFFFMSKNTPTTETDSLPPLTEGTKIATFAGGCFWCMQSPYDALPGVIDSIVGYTDGHLKNPTYKDITTGSSGHAEAVRVIYNPRKTTYEDLLEAFWHTINPTQEMGQFADKGTQYRTAIYYHSDTQKKAALTSKKALQDSQKFDAPIVTEITKASKFYPAEQEHQDFYKKNPLYYNRYKKGSGREDYLKKTWK
jgi:peptide methionine sulfoxide reductase msrA/msrB